MAGQGCRPATPPEEVSSVTMGKLIASTIPNLISGVSQQPWNVRLTTQAEEQVNCHSSVTDFLRRRPATRHIAKALSSKPPSGVAMHTINRDEQEQYIVLASATGFNVFDLGGNPKTVNADEDALAYLEGVTDPGKDLRFLTINDYTFVLNRKKTVKALDESSPERTHEALVFIKQASYNTTYTVTLDGTPHSFTTLDGVAPADEPADELSSKQIAEALMNSINTNGGGSSTYAVSYSNSTLWIRRKDGGNFTLKAEDTRSNTHITVIKKSVQRFSDLPLVAPRGFVVEVIGDSTSSFDNYYCIFEPTDENDAFGSGLWKETVAPGLPYKLDPSTMPHAFIRQADGTFTFTPLTWDERTCGDDESAPFPSFTNRTINALFFYRNRLSFLSGENVVMSEVGKFFNFFITTATTLVDSDVIDVAASHTKSSILEHAVVFNGGLLLFSDQTQYVLEHDTVLANATVSVKPVTEFEASTLAAPVSSGKTVFFATDKLRWGGVREYLTLPDNTDQNDATDITSHIPQYISPNINRLLCSTNDDILFVLSANRRNALWVYKYYWNGNEKIQSAWSRWELSGDILSAGIVGTKLYLALSYPDDDAVYLEALDFAPGNRDEGMDFEVCLDRMLHETDVTIGDYDPITKTTPLTLPFPMNGDPLIVTRSGRILSWVRDGEDAGVCNVSGEIKDTPLFIGVPFESSYTFSTFAVRENGSGGGGGNAVTTGRLQLRSLSLSCNGTGFIEIDVTPSFRKTSTYTFTGRELGHGTNVIGNIPLYTGTIKCPLLSLNTQAVVRVHSDSFLPFALVNAAWEGFYNARHSRV